MFEGELEENQQWDYSFHVSSSGFDTTEIDVTLVWTDPPGSVSCSSSCLVHDLDLRVWEAGTQLYPNFGAATNGDYAGQADQANNVEKVSISSAVDGTSIDVSVLAGGLGSADTQKFALVVTGPLVTSAPSSGPTTAPPSAHRAPHQPAERRAERRTEPAADYDDSATERTAKYRAHRDSTLPPTPRPTTPSPSSVPVPSPTGVRPVQSHPTRLACLNGQQDNSETDVDCGGPECAPCEVSAVRGRIRLRQRCDLLDEHVRVGTYSFAIARAEPGADADAARRGDASAIRDRVRLVRPVGPIPCAREHRRQLLVRRR